MTFKFLILTFRTKGKIAYPPLAPLRFAAGGGNGTSRSGELQAAARGGETAVSSCDIETIRNRTRDTIANGHEKRGAETPRILPSSPALKVERPHQPPVDLVQPVDVDRLHEVNRRLVRSLDL